MSSDAVQYELEDGVAVIRLDDGKANAISPDVVSGIHAALDRAEKEARAVILAGRAGRFSAGFDLSVMRGGPDQVVALVSAGGELALRFYGFPRPVVAACTGHALAMGAILLLSADARVGAEGSFKIGLNEVSIGLALPVFGVELARERLSKRHLTRAVETAELYTPSGAVDAGFLDRVTSPDTLLDEARGEARRLGELNAKAFAGTKKRLRASTIERIGRVLKEDVESMVRGSDLNTL
jgi:enoyl-CoA hydratase